MTKREYFNLKGLHTCSPSFNPDDELDDDFKNAVDTLVDNFDEIYDDCRHVIESEGKDAESI